MRWLKLLVLTVIAFVQAACGTFETRIVFNTPPAPASTGVAVAAVPTASVPAAAAPTEAVIAVSPAGSAAVQPTSTTVVPMAGSSARAPSPTVATLVEVLPALPLAPTHPLPTEAPPTFPPAPTEKMPAKILPTLPQGPDETLPSEVPATFPPVVTLPPESPATFPPVDTLPPESPAILPPVDTPSPSVPPAYPLTFQGTRLHMASGGTSVEVKDKVGKSRRLSYLAKAEAGQFMQVTLDSVSSDLALEIQAPDGSFLASPRQELASWQGALPEDGDYRISVVSSGAAASFELQVIIPVRISFAGGAVSGSARGQLRANGIVNYLLRARKGQTMTVIVTSRGKDIVLEIYGVSDGEPYLRSAMGQTTFSFKLPATQDYAVNLVSAHPDTESYTVEFVIK